MSQLRLYLEAPPASLNCRAWRNAMIRQNLLSTLLLFGTVAAFAFHGYDRSKPQVRRIAMVIGIKADQIDAYERLHADSNSGVRDLLMRAHIRNFSIYIRQLQDGNNYLFGYYEYWGKDYDADMAKLASEPRNKEWVSVTDAMQIPLKGEKSWAIMQQVYHND
jgi:L-rhamnose mutarotase